MTEQAPPEPSPAPTPDAPAASAPRGRSGRKPPLVFKLILLVFVLGFCLIAAEVVLRIAMPGLTYGPNLVQHHPEYGSWLKPDVDRVITNSRGVTYRIRTNDLAHRADPYDPEAQRHIVCLGDSYTMGDAVDHGKEFAGLLRARLADSGTEVVNFAKAGNGQGRWLKFLEGDVDAYEPALVVLQLCYNDFGDNEVEGLFKLDEAGRLVERPVPAPSGMRKYQPMVESLPLVAHLALYQSAKLALKGGEDQLVSPETVADADASDPEASARRTRLTMALIDRVLTLCGERGWPVVAMNVGTTGERRELFESLLAKHGASQIDIPSIEDRPDLYHESDPHWNEAGHRFVADAVGQYWLSLGESRPSD